MDLNPKLQANQRRPVYISEQLTKRRQYLSKMARELKRKKKVDFVWISDGDLFIRKNKDSTAVKVKYKQQLEQHNE